MHEDLQWTRARSWLEGARLDQTKGSLSVLGVPLNHSISPGRCDLAPDAVRQALARWGTYDVERDLDVRSLRAVDLGDVGLNGSSPEDAAAPIMEAMMGAVPGFEATVLLGGDNGVTRAGVLGMAQALNLKLEQVGLVTIDAHLDMRHLGDGLHNGNPVRALLDDDLPGQNIVQVGIAAFTNSEFYARFGSSSGVKRVTLERARSEGLGTAVTRAISSLPMHCEAVYVDVDIDCLDSAFAPGCPGARPGGFASWELLDAVRRCGVSHRVRVVDIVEIDPERDPSGLTALVGSGALMYFASGLVTRLS
ncbi:MAG: agmatinase family protein [Fimbriimonadaceae bacterium]|nr:agmatinase family protein [Fimbriimonadaceae bacterium]QYK56864.1 MAG: agmatinase family protein [Fimbriimonadaceae bacterium]